MHWVALPGEYGARLRDPGWRSTPCPDLDLYDRLLKASWQCYGQTDVRYVEPCDPDNSYLIQKTEGAPLCTLETPEGPKPTEAMPIGATMDPPELATLRAWIANGAPRADGSGFDCDDEDRVGGSGGRGGGDSL